MYIIYKNPSAVLIYFTFYFYFVHALISFFPNFYLMNDVFMHAYSKYIYFMDIHD